MVAVRLILSIDVVAFIIAIYLTGADKSWLFFLLFLRAAVIFLSPF